MTEKLRTNWQAILAGIALAISVGTIVYQSGRQGARLSAVERAVEVIPTIDQRLSRIEGALGIPMPRTAP